MKQARGRLNEPKSCGYIPEHFPEGIRFQLKEYLILMGQISGINGAEINRRIAVYAERFQIKSFLQTPLKKCSKGTMQKAGIIQALLSDNELLLLDEPLTGLDPASKNELLDILKELKNEHTIVFTAHEKETADLLADRVFVLEGGRLRIDGAFPTSEEQMFTVSAKVPDHINEALWKDLQATVKKQNGASEFTVAEVNVDELLLLLLQNGGSVRDVRQKRGKL
ncbi:hypothetical protein CVD28_18485 [Bacillus sp. M6-12]|uniref:ATP-binding cassette domain-containing protein n=1 Tax=Bacillus sp. M6-12 TaxID=2054166 RepID=UPI000C785CA2|nr:ATP-binding cassette domain-containing protein [Bacillus sp. M6-12]PLS16040.1 hypothetical protein CVD28_18485 [Bacillus sp. M6-12]